jgi:hypothetical protein
MFRYSKHLIVTFCISATTLLCQTPDSSAWKRDGTIGINLTQVSLTNWAGGGQNTIAANGLLNLSQVYNLDKTRWETTLDIGYGMTKLAKQDFRKSDDKVILISKFGYKASSNLSYAALLDFRTQIAEGVEYNSDTVVRRISNILAPANVLVGLGATYVPEDFITITLAPLSNRILIVADDSLNKYRAFGVDSGQTVKFDLGALLNITFKKELMKNVTLESKLSSFAPYHDFTHNLVNWNTLLALKVNDYINANIALDLIYDHYTAIKRDDGTVGPSTQLRNVLGIGFGYKF